MRTRQCVNDCNITLNRGAIHFTESCLLKRTSEVFCISAINLQSSGADSCSNGAGAVTGIFMMCVAAGIRHRFMLIP